MQVERRVVHFISVHYLGARFYVALDEAHQKIDLMEAELARDVESARLFRLLTKLSTVVDRAELNGDESWSEYGDRYMLKLFRDYVFHQVRFAFEKYLYPQCHMCSFCFYLITEGI